MATTSLSLWMDSLYPPLYQTLPRAGQRSLQPPAAHQAFCIRWRSPTSILRSLRSRLERRRALLHHRQYPSPLVLLPSPRPRPLVLFYYYFFSILRKTCCCPVPGENATLQELRKWMVAEVEALREELQEEKSKRQALETRLAALEK